MPKTYLEPNEVEQMEEAAVVWDRRQGEWVPCLLYRVLIRVLFWLGCRISEALAIKVEDVDFAQGTITIKHLKARTRLLCLHCSSRLSRTAKYCPGCGKEVTEPLKKEQEARRIRTIPVDEKTLNMLHDFIARDTLINQDGGGFIFRIGRTQAWKIVKDCAARVGIREIANPETGRIHGVSPHRLRDAFATMVVQQDDSTDSVRLLQQQLGHANIGTTMKYRKIAGREQREWYDNIATREGKT